MDDLISDFIAETREMLEALGGGIVAWEAEPGDRARLDEIFRFVHTVKGNCGFFDLPRIRALSHAAEDALAEVRSGKRAADGALVTAVLAVLDRIGELVEALESGEALASEDDEPLIAALSAEAPTPEAKPEAAEAEAPRAPVRTIRLTVDLLDRMMSGVSDLVLARNELARHLRDTPAGIEVAAAFERVSAMLADLREAITRTRMQRIDSLFAPLPRMVRDLSAETGKPVALDIDGGDVELDREMIEMIRDPLTHIVRNAVDHGIEDDAGRAAAGKPAAGQLRIRARQAGNQILIEIADDGRGIDGDALVAKALAAGTLAPERAERLGEAQKAALIFEAGLSTAAEVTALSGRGVGMDVVRANVERIGGIVDVHSRPGEGTRLTLRVPLTLTIIPGLGIEAAGRRYALPRSAIEEIVRVKGGAVRLESVGQARIATIRGRRMPVVALAPLLGGDETDEQTLVVLKPAGGECYALSVDEVLDHEELVVKPAAPIVMAAGLYAGTTLAEDGRPVLLLDPPGIAACAGLSLERREFESEAGADAAAPAAENRPCLLFRTLSGARRLVPVAAVERIEPVAPQAVAESAGRLSVAIGDRIVPLIGCDAAPDAPIRILRLTDGAAELAYALDEVVDILPFAGEVVPSPAPGEVSGLALIDGEQVEILDLHWLFARAGTAPASGRRLVCALPPGDAWMDSFLRPLLESAGYRVAVPGEAVDIHIVSGVAEAPADARIVRLASADGEPGSIHRYDRAALLGALAAAAGGAG